MSTAIKKQTLRQQMRSARRALSPHQQRQNARLLCRTVTSQLWFQQAKSIALYLPNDGEIDPSLLIQYCWASGKKVYLPKLHPTAKHQLVFVPYTAKSKMRLNCYRIPEPVIQGLKPRPAWALSLVMFPLVAFDQNGGRLGMGGGYYDRTFSFKHLSKGMNSTKLIGLAHDLQKTENLPTESWDIPLQGIATDKHYYPC